MKIIAAAIIASSPDEDTLPFLQIRILVLLQKMGLVAERIRAQQHLPSISFPSHIQLMLLLGTLGPFALHLCQTWFALAQVSGELADEVT